MVVQERADHADPQRLSHSAIVYRDRVWLVGQRTLWSYDRNGGGRTATSLPLPGFKPFRPMDEDKILWVDPDTQTRSEKSS